MGKQLGQGDIDALFAAAGANDSAAAAGPEASLERYDFSRAGQISNDQMRAISSVNDLFARNLMHTLSAWLRTPFKMKLVAGEQLPFSEFLERLSPMSYICSVRLEPLGAVGLLELELALASPIVDVLLGGVGRAWPPRDLTDIEESILTSVVQMAVRELNLAWQPVGLEFVFEKRELEPRMRELIGEAKIGAVLQFPVMRLRASELAAIEPGTVLRLPLPKHSASELRVGGLQFGRAHPVRTGEHRGAQLELDSNQEEPHPTSNDLNIDQTASVN
jgi:flagellar motor switch protein FliM